jgi:hypothetical protein
MEDDEYVDRVDGKQVWHVTIPAIALIAADTAEEAERVMTHALERCGFHPYEEDRRVFESDPVPRSSVQTARDFQVPRRVPMPGD